MSTPEWKAYLDEEVFIQFFGRIDLTVRLNRSCWLDKDNQWEWSIVDQLEKRILLAGEASTKKEAMADAENAAKELAQALMPLLGEKG